MVACVCIPSALVRLPLINSKIFRRPLNSIIIYNAIFLLIPICLMTTDFTMLSSTIHLLICTVDIFWGTELLKDTFP